MPQIVWKHKAENPGPYDTVYGHVDGADQPRFVVQWDKAGLWIATDKDGGGEDKKMSLRYPECVDWCWQRLPAHESVTQSGS